jgi:hypothetical protein
MRGSLTLFVLLLGCSRAERVTVGGAPVSSSALRDGSLSAPLPRAQPTPSSASAVALEAALPPVASVAAVPQAALEPQGSVSFVVQHVSGVCAIGAEPGATRHFSVGSDLLLEIRPAVGGKPSRDFVSCPKQGSDGREAHVTLNTWRMCRAYPACTLVGPDGPGSRVELQCGNDHLSLESSAGHTVLRGPFGVREIAAFPMNIVKTRRENRDAWVDC